MKKKSFLGFLVCVCALWLCAAPVQAQEAGELDVEVSTADGRDTAKLRDNAYATTVAFGAGETLTLTAKEPVAGIYIEWAKTPSPWRLECGGAVREQGGNGFLHEYVALDVPSERLTIVMPEGNVMCNIQAWSKGDLPASVQAWEPQCGRADMLVLSSHADDEILFLGGVLAEYAGEKKLAVQVVYFSDYTSGTIVREHEKLDGLWAAGVRNYPENGGFDDIYAEDLASAEKLFGYDKVLGWVVEMIRKYRPLVCVAQDANGEYGHGTHRLTSKAMQEAVGISMDGGRFPASAEKYGAYDVPKTYLHLYGENKISLDCRKPLGRFGGKTALDVAMAAYKQHVSQQWCWFYVSDTYEYSIAEFGLYRTTVGTDTANDMMEHLASYEEQERLRREAEEKESRERQSAEDAEKESRAKEEGRSKAGGKESASAWAIVRTVMAAIMWVLLLSAAGLWIYASYVRRKRRRRRRKRKKKR